MVPSPPPSSAALMSHRSYLDLSDSESEVEGLEMRTPAANICVHSPASSTHSSARSRAQNGECRVEANATWPAASTSESPDLTSPSAKPNGSRAPDLSPLAPSSKPVVSIPAHNSAKPVTVTLAPIQPWGKLPHGGLHTAMPRTPTSPPRPSHVLQERTRSLPGSPVNQSKPSSPSYTELEKAFMARVAARQTQLSRPENPSNHEEPASPKNLPPTETSIEYERRLKGMSFAIKGDALWEVSELDLSDQATDGARGQFGQFGAPPPPPEKRKASHGVAAYGGAYRTQWKPTGVER